MQFLHGLSGEITVNGKKNNSAMTVKILQIKKFQMFKLMYTTVGVTIKLKVTPEMD